MRFIFVIGRLLFSQDHDSTRPIAHCDLYSRVFFESILHIQIKNVHYISDLYRHPANKSVPISVAETSFDQEGLCNCNGALTHLDHNFSQRLFFFRVGEPIGIGEGDEADQMIFDCVVFIIGTIISSLAATQAS